MLNLSSSGSRGRCRPSPAARRLAERPGRGRDAGARRAGRERGRRAGGLAAGRGAGDPSADDQAVRGLVLAARYQLRPAGGDHRRPRRGPASRRGENYPDVPRDRRRQRRHDLFHRVGGYPARPGRPDRPAHHRDVLGADGRRLGRHHTGEHPDRSAGDLRADPAGIQGNASRRRHQGHRPLPDRVLQHPGRQVPQQRERHPGGERVPRERPHDHAGEIRGRSQRRRGLDPAAPDIRLQLQGGGSSRGHAHPDRVPALHPAGRG